MVYDSETTEMPPPWATEDDIATSSAYALAIAGLHPDDGEITARLWRYEGPGTGEVVFRGGIDVPSGIVMLSNAVFEEAQSVPIEAGHHEIAVFANSSSEPDLIDVVLDPRDG